MDRKLLVGAWSPVVLSPRSDNTSHQLFDASNVKQVHLWMGATTPGDVFNVRLQLHVGVIGRDDAEAALGQLGRDPEEYEWATIENYENIRVAKPTPTDPWSVMVGAQSISPGPLLVLNQVVGGRVRCQVLQSEGMRRLLLYRLVCE